jgi:hypothetical protein
MFRIRFFALAVQGLCALALASCGNVDGGRAGNGASGGAMPVAQSDAAACQAMAVDVDQFIGQHLACATDSECRLVSAPALVQLTPTSGWHCSKQIAIRLDAAAELLELERSLLDACIAPEDADSVRIACGLSPVLACDGGRCRITG